MRPKTKEQILQEQAEACGYIDFKDAWESIDDPEELEMIIFNAMAMYNLQTMQMDDFARNNNK